MGSSRVEVFISYSHVDEPFRRQLDAHLAQLQRNGVIDSWHDRKIAAGAELDRAIDARLESADIILLLVSSDFLASDYCYEREMRRALERHEQNSAVVIPVIIRHVDWDASPFRKLVALPTDGRPVASFPDRDEAWTIIAKAIRSRATAIRQSKQSAADASHGHDRASVTVAPPASATNAHAPKGVPVLFLEFGQNGIASSVIVEAAKVVARSDIELSIVGPDAEALTLLRRLQAQALRTPVVAFGLDARECTVRHCQQTLLPTGEQWEVVLAPESRDFTGGPMEMSFAQFSPDQQAELRARRILLDEPLPQHYPDGLNSMMLDSFVSGFNTRLSVKSSPIPALWGSLHGDPPGFLVAARLFSVAFLKLTGTVERISRLELGFEEPEVLSVRFDGERGRRYTNVEPFQISVAGVVRLGGRDTGPVKSTPRR